MRKLYIIVSYPVGTHEGVITGVVANGTGRDATDEERNAVIDRLRTAGATPSLLDALREKVGGYHKLSVYDRRQAARNEHNDLNGYGSFLFTWHIVEVGESIRKPVRQVKGWRIKYGGDCTSCYNSVEDGATVRDDGDEENNSEYNLLFPTRAAARDIIDTRIGDKRSKHDPSGYYIEAVYA
ncbi:hypothetical protein HOR13_gp46 [Xanthomonas phage XAJ24]|uniref:Uncharacterized protein n=1 Tax=Xanthomonas phage XAJ24 TaxID=1775250 RepID=A0A1I9L287_9CAUD|nr:hypothetical protein HOR13_gp46 [Xanthomonas phage XAJ24]AMW36074.1 hypothetical protein [Xanthomonas phage XAJ24]